MDDEWSCGQCDFLNTSTLSSCAVCKAPRKRGTDQVSSLGLTSLSSLTLSEGRTLIHDSGSLAFDMSKPVLLEDFICPPSGASGSGSLKQNKGRSKVTGSISTSVSASAQSKWTCSSCTYDNWPNASRCTMCKAARRCLSAKTRRGHQNGWHGVASNAASSHNGGSRTSLPLSDQSSGTGRASAPRSSSRGKAAAQKRLSGSPTRKWVCKTCTYENWPKASRCTICRTVRSPIQSPVLEDHLSDRLSPSECQQRKNLFQYSATSTPIERSVTLREWETSHSVKDERNERERSHQVRNRLNQTDWLFLKACQGVVDNEIDSVMAYVRDGGHLARQLTEDDLVVLGCPSAFEVGHTLVHLALRFKREEVLSAMLTPALTDAHKRLPNHANEEVATSVRKYMASSLQQRKGDWPCYFMTESKVFSLPSEVKSLSKAAQQQLLDDVVDKNVQQVLEDDSPVINWSRELTCNYGSRLYPLWNRTAGDCLLDSVLQATWSVFDREGALRSALYTCLSEGASRFYARWREWETLQASALNYSVPDYQWEQDWDNLVMCASQPGRALEQMHVFVLAHILRRPIIVYGVKYVKSFRGETLDLAKFQGIYLPLLWEDSFCYKSPVALGYTRGHFSALIAIDGGCSENAVAEASNLESKHSSSHAHWLPLVDHEGSLLPVHFLTKPELGNEDHLLRESLNCDFTLGGILVAKQKCSVQVHLVSQLVDDWLDKYRKLSSFETEPL